MIRCEDVRKRYGEVRAIDGVTLGVGTGERVAFVGANGSGKTTLLRAVVGLLQIEGRVTIDGIDVARHPEQALRDVVYIPQIAPPVDVPVAELVRAYASLRGVRPAAVAERAARLGIDLDRVRKTRFRDLSGGTKQKILAALALATDARLLVCDEPTANLDPAARAAFFDEVLRRPDDAILVLCSHRTEEVVHLVGRVVELADGRVIRDEALDVLLEDLRSYRIEVDLRPDAQRAADWLADQGFVHLGMRRWGRQCTLREKLAVATQLLEKYRDQLVDLRVLEAQELGLGTGPAGAEAAR